MLTGYGRLEASLRETLMRDLPRIGLVAAVLVMIALFASLRRPLDVALAALVVLAEVALVLLLVRLFDVPLHAYDALVLPVLLGITVDEAMFLLHRARADGLGEAQLLATLRHEGPLVAATALTTAAGFGALAFCDFDGLRDLGRVGAIGSVCGLVVALLVVPAGLRLRPPARPRPGARAGAPGRPRPRPRARIAEPGSRMRRSGVATTSPPRRQADGSTGSRRRSPPGAGCHVPSGGLDGAGAGRGPAEARRQAAARQARSHRARRQRARRQPADKKKPDPSRPDATSAGRRAAGRSARAGGAWQAGHRAHRREPGAGPGLAPRAVIVAGPPLTDTPAPRARAGGGPGRAGRRQAPARVARPSRAAGAGRGARRARGRAGAGLAARRDRRRHATRLRRRVRRARHRLGAAARSGAGSERARVRPGAARRGGSPFLPQVPLTAFAPVRGKNFEGDVVALGVRRPRRGRHAGDRQRQPPPRDHVRLRAAQSSCRCCRDPGRTWRAPGAARAHRAGQRGRVCRSGGRRGHRRRAHRPRPERAPRRRSARGRGLRRHGGARRRRQRLHAPAGADRHRSAGRLHAGRPGAHRGLRRRSVRRLRLGASGLAARRATAFGQRASAGWSSCATTPATGRPSRPARSSRSATSIRTASPRCSAASMSWSRARTRSWCAPARGKPGAAAPRPREVARLPAAAGVQALAVCPPDGPGRAPFVVATADEIWVVR
ncbi:MAG: MMPL family transporter [Polyangiaceae bacterium]